jgi:hypothetical protein
VDGALRRAFGDAVLSAGGAGLAGDFNGDGVEDVVAPVAPAVGRLAEVNDDLAPWQIQDALAERSEVVVPAGHAPPTGRPIKAEAADELLAVIHGYGPRGWRDQEARQSYLVRRAVGPAPLEAQPRSMLTRYVQGVSPDAQLQGDVILSSAGGRPGFVYWTGVRYAWHPLPSRARADATSP